MPGTADVCALDVSLSSIDAAAIRFSVHAGRRDLLPPPGLPASQVWRGLGNEVLAYGYTLGARWWIEWPGVGTFVLSAGSADAVVIPDPGIDRASLEDFIRRGATPVALLHRDHEVLHASAVRHPHGVVAFCASSGTGKSTLAAAVAGSPCEFWADDFVAWDIAGSAAHCAWFPSASRLDAAAAAALRSPTAMPAAAGPTRVAELAAIAILSRDERVERGAAVIRRVPPERAFRAVLPHAHDSRIGGRERVRRSLERHLELCSLVPVFDVAFKPDLARVADLARHVVTWMDSLRAPASR